jgi:hypothetical protein
MSLYCSYSSVCNESTLSTLSNGIVFWSTNSAKDILTQTDHGLLPFTKAGRCLGTVKAWRAFDIARRSSLIFMAQVHRFTPSLIHTTTTLIIMFLLPPVRGPNRRLTCQQQFFMESLLDVATCHHHWKIRDRICDGIGSWESKRWKVAEGSTRDSGSAFLKDFRGFRVVSRVQAGNSGFRECIGWLFRAPFARGSVLE